MYRRSLVLFFCVVFLAGAPVLAGERFERTIHHEAARGADASFHFENLIGSMTVRGDDTNGKVLVEARVVTEADNRDAAKALAESIELTAVTEDARRVVRVSYPVDRHSAFRLPRSERGGLLDKWVTPLVRKSTVAAVYEGRTVEVGRVKGAASLAVHLEVTLPMDIDASFKQIVGSLHVVGVRGSMSLEAIEGQIMADQAYGSLQIRTGGGEILVRKFGGEGFRLQTGSGNVTLMEVRAKDATLLTGSGKIDGTRIKTDALEIDSGTGGVLLRDVDTVALQVKSQSGHVDVGALITRTREASIKTEAGDVILRVNQTTPFELHALARSGSVKHRELSAEIVDEDKNELHLRRGQGGAALEIEAGKGEVMIRPI